MPFYQNLQMIRKTFLLKLEDRMLDGTLNRNQKKQVIEYLLEQSLKYGIADEDMKALFNRYQADQPEFIKSTSSENLLNIFPEEAPLEIDNAGQLSSWEKARAEHQNTIRNRKRLAQTQKLKRSVKTVYTGLMKVFHPDTETDPDRKSEKEEISKLITVAYGKQDFIGLLRLESEFLIRQKNKDSFLNENQIQQYIEVLKVQKVELRKQLSQLKTEYTFLFEPVASGSEKPLQQLIKSEKAAIESAVLEYRSRLRILQDGDGPQLKMLLFALSDELNERNEGNQNTNT